MAERRRPRERAGRRVEHLEVAQADPTELVDRARHLAGAATGWIVLRPHVDDSAEPPPAPGSLATIFSAVDLRHQVPLCSWVPGRRSRRGVVRPDSLGIQHGTGPRAVSTLAARGVALPDGWRRAQDHARRGLVVVPAVGSSVEEMVSWLMRAGAALSEQPVTGRWHAEIHTSG